MLCPSYLCRYTALSGFTGLAFTHPETSAQLAAGATSGQFTSPYWLTRAQLRVVSEDITLLAGQVPVTVIYPSTKAIIDLYNAEQTTHHEAILSFVGARTNESEPLHATTNTAFGRPRVGAMLAKIAKEQGYKSPYWLSQADIDACFTKDDVRIKEGQSGTDVAAALRLAADVNGSPFWEGWSDLADDPLRNVFFNAEQTTRPDVIQRHTAKGLVALSGKTGKPFAFEQQGKLQAAAAERQFKSTYWVTEGQLGSFDPALQLRPGEVGIIVHLRDFKSKKLREILVYNVDQIMDGGEEVIKKHLASLSKE